MVAVLTPTFRDLWQLLSAFKVRFAQMKLIALERDNLEMAIFIKDALVVVAQLKALKTLTMERVVVGLRPYACLLGVETVVAALKPYHMFLGSDLETFLLTLLQETSTQDDIILALLGDLSAALERDKTRAVSNDDLVVALAIQRTATVVARFQSDPPSAKDVLLDLEAHMEVMSEEWHARIHSLIPSTALEDGPPLKRGRND
jgi:hypothetical protein